MGGLRADRTNRQALIGPGSMISRSGRKPKPHRVQFFEPGRLSGNLMHLQSSSFRFPDDRIGRSDTRCWAARDTFVAKKFGNGGVVFTLAHWGEARAVTRVQLN